MGQRHVLSVLLRLGRLALVNYRKGDYGQAEALDREAYGIRRARFGAGSDEAARSLNQIAMDLRKKGEQFFDELPASHSIADHDQTRFLHGSRINLASFHYKTISAD